MARSIDDRNSKLLKIGQRVLRFTHLDKILFPKNQFTKKDVLRYYHSIAPILLPHLHNFPLTLKRYPNGVEGEMFYEKRCPAHRPDWVKTTLKDGIDFCMANDLSTLVWVTQLASLELHTYLAKNGTPQQPEYVVFDLDPGAPARLIDCIQVAFELKAFFDDLGLQSFAKTSGGKGMQLYLPLHSKADFLQTKNWSHQVALRMEREFPKKIVSKMAKILRPGKVLIDWSQNDSHKTTICAYSLRAQATPTVSTPVDWSELQSALKKRSAESLIFSPQQVLARVQHHGDIFKKVLTLKQVLPPLAPQSLVA